MAWNDWATRMATWGLGQLLLTYIFLALPAASQWDPATGYIEAIAGAGVPSFDPAPWNAAYKVTYRNVPFNGPFDGSHRSWPYTPDSEINTLEDCFTEGVDDASAVNASVVSRCHDIKHVHSWLLVACTSSLHPFKGCVMMLNTVRHAVTASNMYGGTTCTNSSGP